MKSRPNTTQSDAVASKDRKALKIAGLELKSAREARDVSQEDAAKEVGATHSTYSKWEQGKNPPEAAFLAKLALIYGGSVMGNLPRYL